MTENEKVHKSLKIMASAIALVLAATDPAYAAAIRNSTLFTGNTLAANDDWSTGLVGIGFDIDFYGLAATNQLYVNNNGNVTFNAPLSTFTPFGLLTSSTPIIAPFFADVDTFGAGSGLVQYGTGVIDGRNVFGVNWIDVGYFAARTNRLNSFQLILTSRADIAAGDFDFEFNYDRIVWESGDASGGLNGLGGFSARAGWTDGGATDYEFVGSGVNGALLDGGINALVSGSLNSDVAGRYVFQVRSGVVQPPVTVPEPATIALLGTGLLGMIAARRSKQRHRG